MTSIKEAVKRLFTPVMPLPPGLYHYQAPPDSPSPYRLHLRLEPDGTGLLIINASTILHLNQTAAEFAYHLVKQTPEEKIVSEISNRYRVNKQPALRDYQILKERIDTLIQTPDLDPETFLEFSRITPHIEKLSAPYRLDCAITYRLSELSDEAFAPLKRVDRELSTEEWLGVFDKAWGFGIPHIILTGGEPTLRADLPALIAHTERNGQIVGLISDGINLIDKGYLQTLLQTGLDHLLLTLYPNNVDSWKALENVLSADLFVAVHLTLTSQNIMTMNQTIDRLANMGVKAISLSASDPALLSSLVQFRNHAAAIGLTLVWDLPVPYSAFNPVALETQLDNPAAGAGHSWLYIEPDGDVLASQGSDQVFGNILRDPWEQLWR